MSELMANLLLIGGAPFLLALAILCLREPMRVALPLYAGSIPFGDALSIGGSRFGSASSLLGLLAGLGLLGQLVTTRRLATNLSPSVPIWLMFLAVSAATGLWSIDAADTISGFMVLGSLVTIFVLGAVSDADTVAVRRTESALIAGAVGVVAYGALQLFVLGGFGSSPDASPDQGGRFGDDLLGPSILAVTLLMPMAIALHRLLGSHGRERTAPYLLVVLVLLIGVLMTGSRTGLVGAALMTLTMMWASPRRARDRLAATLLVGAVVTLGVWVYHPFGIAERTFETVTSSSGRVDIWEVGVAACPDYCVWGSGWGTFPQVYMQNLATVPEAKVLGGSDTGAYEAHNVWLLALVETGVLGVLLVTLGLLAALVTAVRLPDSYRPQAVGMLTALVTGLLFLSSLEFKICWLVLLLVVMYRNASPPGAAAAAPEPKEMERA